MKVVYFKSCVNRIFGPSADDRGEPGVAARIVNILHKANCEIILLQDAGHQCCGLAFTSQGFAQAGHSAMNRLGQALLEASDGGRHPIVCDMSPCTLEARHGLAHLDLPIHDIVDFTTSYLFDRLQFTPSDEVVGLFPVCSLKKMGLEDDLRQVGRRCAADVHLADSTCCGFAGNRGFLVPELNAWGLRRLRDQLPAHLVTAAYSTSRTCEIGLTTHSDRRFDSLVKLIDGQTSPLV